MQDSIDNPPILYQTMVLKTTKRKQIMGPVKPTQTSKLPQEMEFTSLGGCSISLMKRQWPKFTSAFPLEGQSRHVKNTQSDSSLCLLSYFSPTPFRNITRHPPTIKQLNFFYSFHRLRPRINLESVSFYFLTL